MRRPSDVNREDHRQRRVLERTMAARRTGTVGVASDGRCAAKQESVAIHSGTASGEYELQTSYSVAAVGVLLHVAEEVVAYSTSARPVMSNRLPAR
ncbi:MAG: hypothetical protein R3178_06915 [Rhodothermales bacterium]|nr:hypothetical protein [Rhodothermales bacterium]